MADGITTIHGSFLRTHAADQCSGEFCSVHNPSDHPLRDAPYNWRSDRGVLERVCDHGVGHPDPDDVAHHLRIAPQDADWYSVHGCDGCCSAEGAPVTTIYAVDPGKATGFAILEYSEESPARVVAIDVLTGLWEIGDWARYACERGYTVVSEKFVLNAGNEFTADLSAKEVEGVLKLILGDSIVWRSRADKAQVPDQILKDYDMWVVGSEVGWEDGRDVNDAIKHGLGHIAFTEKHIPTLRKYFRD